MLRGVKGIYSWSKLISLWKLISFKIKLWKFMESRSNKRSQALTRELKQFFSSKNALKSLTKTSNSTSRCSRKCKKLISNFWARKNKYRPLKIKSMNRNNFQIKIRLLRRWLWKWRKRWIRRRIKRLRKRQRLTPLFLKLEWKINRLRNSRKSRGSSWLKLAGTRLQITKVMLRILRKLRVGQGSRETCLESTRKGKTESSSTWQSGISSWRFLIFLKAMRESSPFSWSWMMFCCTLLFATRTSGTSPTLYRKTQSTSSSWRKLGSQS